MATILVVDDRPINREFLVTLLNHFGHQVIEAGDGMEALKLAEARHPALVITDIHMPSMDGQELLERLRAHPALAQTPIILFTATYKVPRARELAGSGSVSAVLCKPAEPEAILRAVNAALGLPAWTPASSGGETAAGRLMSTPAEEPPTVNSVLAALSHRLSALVEVVLDLALERDPERLFATFCHMARELVGAAYAMVGVLNEDDQTFPHLFFSRVGPEISPWAKASPCRGILNELLKVGHPIRLRDVSAGRLGIDALPDASPTSSFLGVPIVSPARPYGWLCLLKKLGADEFSEDDARLGATLAAQVAVVYENIKLYRDIRSYVARLEAEVQERILTEKKLEQNRQEQLQLKDQFLSHVSHELRSPITAVHQFVTILLDGLAGGLSPAQREYLEIALRNVSQLRRMIEDLLEITCADTGKLNVEPCCMPLGDLVAEILDTFRARSANEGIALSAEVPRQLPAVYADASRIRQILTNLLDNAIQYTPPGGAITIRPQVFDEAPKFVCVSVTDTGRGISPEDAQLIFERFYQVADPDRGGRKGLGLGLYICKELVARQGGRIWVESQPRHGSTFSFTLPVFSLAELITPILGREDHAVSSVVLIRIAVFPGQQWPSAKARETALRETRKVLERCLLPDLDVLLPRMCPTSSGEVFLVLARADAGGAEVLVRRIREQLGRCEHLADATQPPTVSSTLIDIPPGAGKQSRERNVEYVVACLETLARNNPSQTEPTSYVQKNDTSDR